jgi:hypothetical protein
MGEIRSAYIILSANRKGRDHFDNLGVDERIILECILKKQGWKVWLESSDSVQEPVAGSCEHVNESSCFMKGRKFPD